MRGFLKRVHCITYFTLQDVFYHALPDNLMIFGSHTISFARQIIKYPARIWYIRSGDICIPRRRKTHSINKALRQWHGLWNNLLRTIDRGLFCLLLFMVYATGISGFSGAKNQKTTPVQKCIGACKQFHIFYSNLFR